MSTTDWVAATEGAPSSPLADQVLVQVLDHLDAYCTLTITEVGQFANANGMDLHGDLTWTPTTNVILAADLSDDFAALLIQLAASDRVKVQAMTLMEAIVLGGPLLDLPVARRITAAGYRRPHWVPILFLANARR